MKHFFLALTLLLSVNAFAQKDAYQIKVKINGFEKDTLFLAFHYGDKQYMRDTAAVKNGWFTFSKNEALPGGIYLVVMPPDNKYFEILVNEQNFTVETDITDLVKNMKITGSVENKVFYEDINFIGDMKKKGEELNAKLQATEEGTKEHTALKEQLDALDKQVKAQREKLVKDNPGLFYSKLLTAMKEPEVPEAPKKEDGTTDPDFGWRYYKTHFWDNYDFSDDKLLRTPVYFGKLNRYMNQVLLQHPDTLSKEADALLKKSRANDEVFKYTLVHLLNDYANSKIMGMDAVYVHLVENYYAKGDASWTDSTQLYRLMERAQALKPLLIGKKAPALTLKNLQDQPVSLQQIPAKYTLIYFYDPDCGHCKKSTPKMVEVSQKFKKQDLAVYAVCTEHEEDKWRKFVEEYKTHDWINVADVKLQNNFRSIWDIKSTPVIFLLDEKKEIIGKRLAPEQLEEFLLKLLEKDKEKVEQKG